MRIKNWEQFQHYKSGKNASKRPDWIKLYTCLLDDYDFHSLSGDDAKALIMLWMLGSERQGVIPDTKTIAFRLRLKESQVLAILGRLSHWLEDIPRNDLGQNKKRIEENRKEGSVYAPAEHNGVVVSRVCGEVDKAFDNWNTMAEALGLAAVRDRTKQRRQKLAARLKDSGGLPGWNAALESLADQPFLHGQNDRSWKVNFDWLVAPTNFTKVSEGVYKR